MLLNREKAVPFRFEAGKTGCILVHGFTGSPFEMRGIGEHLAGRGISCVGPLLPGHGVDDAALNSTSWREWFGTVVEAFDELASRCHPVYAVGLSMGGVLSLHLAAHRPVAGVVALAPFLWPSDWRLPFLSIIKHVRSFDPKGQLDINDPSGRSSFAGYDTHPTWGVAQMMELCRHLADDLPEVQCPVVIMHGRMDHTISFDQMDLIAARLGSRKKWRIALERSFHVLPLDYDREIVMETAGRFIEAGGTLEESSRRPAVVVMPTA